MRRERVRREMRKKKKRAHVLKNCFFFIDGFSINNEMIHFINYILPTYFPLVK